jgi:itaconate CoA-transferase
VLERPELAADARFDANPKRMAHLEELHATIEEVFSRLTAAQVIERLERAQIANARLNSPQEFWDHPQLQARGRWREIGSPVGPLQALVPPATMPGVAPRMGPIPDVGEHTAAILHALGYEEEEIARLRATEVI